jgi:hypothetical protein
VLTKSGAVDEMPHACIAAMNAPTSLSSAVAGPVTSKRRANATHPPHRTIQHTTNQAVRNTVHNNTVHLTTHTAPHTAPYHTSTINEDFVNEIATLHNVPIEPIQTVCNVPIEPIQTVCVKGGWTPYRLLPTNPEGGCVSGLGNQIGVNDLLYQR